VKAQRERLADAARRTGDEYQRCAHDAAPVMNINGVLMMRHQ
jgi:hypothetical protein